MTDQADRLYERVLVLRCQAGDESAFAELVERYAPRLRYFLRRMLGGDEAVDDLLQDVWLDAYRSAARLDDPGSFAPWLYRIARDRVFRRWRRRGLNFAPLAEAGEPAAGEDERFTVEDAGRVHAALAALAVEHREVLMLRFLEGMSYEQVAQVVGCRVGTVRSRLHYAKIALRKEMERRDGHE